MKKVLLFVGGALGVVVLGVLGAASMQPDTYQVQRSIAVSATPTDVFPYINDYTKWAEWNPWGQLDPNMKVDQSDNEAGVGAWNSWVGNDDVGAGKMSIVESVPDQKVVHKLEFTAPFEDTSLTTFAVSTDGGQSKVTWSMDGKNNLVGKVMCLFMDMEEMIGPDFERGLGNLKPLVEADATARAEQERIAAEAAAAAVVDPNVPVDPNAPVDPAAAPATAAVQ